MRQSDYYTNGFAGEDLEQWLKMQQRSLVFAVRRHIESCPKRLRSCSFENLIQVRLAGLAEYSIGDMQKNVFATLMTKYQNSLLSGEMLEEEAASVAHKHTTFAFCVLHMSS